MGAVGLMSGDKPQHEMRFEKSSLLLLKGSLQLLLSPTTILAPTESIWGHR